MGYLMHHRGKMMPFWIKERFQLFFGCDVFFKKPPGLGSFSDCIVLFGLCLCSRVSRSLQRGTRRTEGEQERAEQQSAPGREQQLEPRPARENSPPAESAKPRKNRRIKTNVSFCNIQRVLCECACFVHLLICEERGLHLFLRGLDTQTHSPDLTTNKGRRCLTNRGFAVPKPQVPAILYPQWNLEIRGRDTTTTTTPYL